jgi:uncharacterized protein YcfJ
MNSIPTYYDFKYANTSKIFESELIKDMTPDQIMESEKLYNTLVEKLQNGEQIDEGLFGALVGGSVGALVGPAIGNAICNVLGISKDGPLGKLLTSRLVSTAMGVALGK